MLMEEDCGPELETIAISDSSTPNRRADRELLNTGGAYGKLHGERSPGKEPNQGRAVCKLPTNSGSPTTGSSALLQLPVLEQRSSVGRRRQPKVTEYLTVPTPAGGGYLGVNRECGG